ncbi:MAG: hypothetical protein OHK0022_42120 [Roseiflexaceae bacterium]
MILGLIGMSCAGKSYWGLRLKEAGFRAWECDELLAAHLGAALGLPGMTMPEAGQWLGLPDTAGYAERERLYLECEAVALEQMVSEAIATIPSGVPMVLDMGGSAIYVRPDLFATMRRFATLVYLDIVPEVRAQMLSDYMAAPRPLIWHGAFRPHEGESRTATFARCYNDLLDERATRYSALAHVQIPYALHRRPGLSPAELLDHIARVRPASPVEI